MFAFVGWRESGVGRGLEQVIFSTVLTLSRFRYCVKYASSRLLSCNDKIKPYVRTGTLVRYHGFYLLYYRSGSALILVVWIRIRAEMTHKNRKKWSAGSLLRAERFSYSLNVLGISELQFEQKNKKDFSVEIFLKFLIIKTLDRIWIKIRIGLNCWIRTHLKPCGSETLVFK